MCLNLKAGKSPPGLPSSSSSSILYPLSNPSRSFGWWNFHILLLISRNPSLSAQLSDQHRKWEGSLELFVPQGHLQVNDHTNIYALLEIINTRQDTFLWRMADSFWDGIIVQVIKPNHNLATTWRSFFFIRDPASNHLRVPSHMKGARQIFMVSKDLVFTLYRWTSKIL